MTYLPNKIISGGQTGADIGGLIGAKRVGIATGGYAPKDYRTEVGEQSEVLQKLGLKEHSSPNYRCRTQENIMSSDATIIFATDISSDGTKLTIKYCKDLEKPFLIVNPFLESSQMIKDFLNTNKPSTLNIAGNRESKSKGIASKTASIIQSVFLNGDKE